MIAEEVTPFTESVGVPLAIAVIGLIATLGAAAMSFALGRWNDTTARRRESYSSATRELVAWAEYPYRIRRRTSDEAAELATLANLGHELQEALRYRQTWIRSENKWVAEVFSEVRADLTKQVGAACAEAWHSEPVTNASGMNLNGWGPAGVDAHIERFENAVSFRFGWRRLACLVGWRPGATPRPVDRV